MLQEGNSELFRKANAEVEAMNGFIAGGVDKYSKNTIDKSNDTLTFNITNPTTAKLTVNIMGINGVSTGLNPPPTNAIFSAILPGIAPFSTVHSICTANNTLYISNLGSDSVSVFDLDTGGVITTIPLPVGFSPIAPAYCPVNNQIYVGGAFPTLSVLRIDCATNTIVGAPIPIATNFDAAANGLIYNSVKNSVYGITVGPGLLEVNCTTNTQTANVVGPATPVATSFNPTQNRIYLANIATNDLDIFDCITNTFLPSVALPLAQPIGIVYCSFNNSVYVTEQGGAQNVVQVDCSTLVVGAPILTGVNVPRGISYNPINNLIYFGGSTTTNYSILDVAANTVGAPIAIANNPTDVIYNQFNNSVWFLDLVANSMYGIAPLIAPSVVVVLPGGVTLDQIFNDLQGKPLAFSGMKMIVEDLNQLFNNLFVQYTSVTGKVVSNQFQPTNYVSPSNPNSKIIDSADFDFVADTNSQIVLDVEPLSTMTIALSSKKQLSNVSFDKPDSKSVDNRENIRVSGNPILDMLLQQDEEERERRHKSPSTVDVNERRHEDGTITRDIKEK